MTGERRKREWTPEMQAKILLESTTGDPKATCKKYSITLRTLQRWRKTIKDGGNVELSRSVAEKRRALDAVWAEKIPGCLGACLDFIAEAARLADKKNADVIQAVTDAMTKVSDVAVTWKVLDVRIAEQTGRGGSAPGQVPAKGNVTPIKRVG